MSASRFLDELGGDPAGTYDPSKVNVVDQPTFVEAVESTRGPIPGTESAFGVTETGASAAAESQTEQPIQGTLARTADESAGMVDESIGRQFDDTPGGGFADEAINQAGKAAGAAAAPVGGLLLTLVVVIAGVFALGQFAKGAGQGAVS